MKNIIVSDFDNTLYNDNYINNKLAVKEFVDNNNIFIINTARTYKSYLTKSNNYIENIKYFICNDGCVLLDNKNNIINKNNINQKQLKLISKLILKYISKMNVKYLDEFGNDTFKDDNINLVVFDISNIDKKDKIKIKKILKKQELKSNIMKNSMYIHNAKGNKGVYLKDIALKENVEENNFYTIGDGHLDIKMNSFGKNYSMKKSQKEMLKRTKYVIDEVENLIKYIMKI